MKALNTLLSPTVPFRLWSDRMSDNRRSPKAKPGRGQELKRTYNTSFGAVGENQVSDTDNSGKEDEGNLPWETMEKVSIECRTLTHKTLYQRGQEQGQGSRQDGTQRAVDRPQPQGKGQPRLGPLTDIPLPGSVGKRYLDDQGQEGDEGEVLHITGAGGQGGTTPWR